MSLVKQKEVLAKSPLLPPSLNTIRRQSALSSLVDKQVALIADREYKKLLSHDNSIPFEEITTEYDS